MVERVKTRAVFICQECGQESLRWQGRCPECQAWNTLVERTVSARPTPATGRDRGSGPVAAPVQLSAVETEGYPRIQTDVSEFDRVLGGGIVPGSLVLIGGDPGIGKCVVGSTRVFNPSTGAFAPIAWWASGEHQVLALDESYHLTPGQVGAFLDQGVRPVVEVTTRLGRKLRCTTSHPVLTPDGWWPVGDLPSGTRIAAPRALPYFGAKQMDEHEVRLIAYALSDGSATSQVSVTAALPEIEGDLRELAGWLEMELRVYPKPSSRAKQYRFVQPPTRRRAARQELATALQRVPAESGLSWAAWARAAGVSYGLLNAWRRAQCVPDGPALVRLAAAAGVDISTLAPEARDRAEMRTLAARILERAGLRYTRAANKAVPQCIFCLPAYQIAKFLRVVFSCDGSVYVTRTGTAGISYSTISRRLAEDIQHLMLRFGFVTKLRDKRSNVGGRPYLAYELQLLGVGEVKRFLRDIGIWGRDAAKEAIAALPEPRLPSTHWDTVPTGPTFWDELRAAAGDAPFKVLSAAAGTTVRNRRHDQPLARSTLRSLARAYPSAYLARVADGDIYWDEIVAIEPAGHEPVYDLFVPGTANFVANDLILHNSTLLLQVAGKIATGEQRVLYISGEESGHQLKLRASRLGIRGEQLFLLTETNLTEALGHADKIQPDLVVVDSIQTVYAPELQNATGSVAQLRECTMRLMQWAKGGGVPVFIVGHVTKEGEIAGPRLLEHIVDVVLYLEGERFSSYRLLRGAKNRFGAVSEVGVFEMLGSGLAGVENPSEIFLAERQEGAIGSVIVPAVEGSRPMLVEVQALTSPTSMSMPRRVANGIEFSRLLLLTAVLTKRAGVRLSDQDVIVNVVGGLKVNEPAADLGVALAIASSHRDAMLPGDMVALGEVGLSGELRSVGHLERRLAEAERLGFTRCVLPRVALRRGRPQTSLDLLPVETLRQALDAVCDV